MIGNQKGTEREANGWQKGKEAIQKWRKVFLRLGQWLPQMIFCNFFSGRNLQAMKKFLSQTFEHLHCN
jgi:hypothetical protein